MPYGDLTGPGYPEGTATARLAGRDLGRPAVGTPSLSPSVQEVTHEITGVGSLIRQVAAAGTRLRLSAASLKCRYVYLEALPTNADVVVVGDANVVAASGTQAAPTRRGRALDPGAWWEFNFYDLTDLWLDSAVSGDGVTAVYFT